MNLEITELAIALADLSIEASLTAAKEQMTVLLGPNGAGKTTLLRAIAGVTPVDRGRIAYGDTVLADASLGIDVRAHARPIAMVWQPPLLFPHLSVRDNIGFGLVAGGEKRRDARAHAEGWLERFGLMGRARAKPLSLSGGETQKVALARALALNRPVLLLDEPFAALDVAARTDARRTLSRELKGVGGVKVLVTHDPVEAIALADHMIVLEAGRVTQTGTPDELKRRPATPYIASVVGVNLLRGTATGHTLTLETGAQLTVAEEHFGSAFANIHPRAIALFRSRPDGTPRNVWRARVASVERGPDTARIVLEGELPLVAEITDRSAVELALRPDEDVWAAVKATEIEVYPA